MSNGSKTIDCIVLGFGGIGSTASYFAAKKGWKVLGIDRYGSAHSFGSSHGQTRIIRTAYFEHPDYVPLARQGFALWDEIQSEISQKIISRTGLLQIGDPEGPVIRGLKESVNRHDLPVEFLSPQDVTGRYPVLKTDPNHVGIFEHEAGYLRVERCVAAWLRRAIGAGAEFRSGTVVTGWNVEDDGTVKVEVRDGSAREVLHCKKLIVTGGAWSGQQLPQLDRHLTVLRKQQQWFQLDRIDIKEQNGFPCFLIETANGCFYGFPELDYLGMKVAEHGAGEPVADPTQLERSLNEDDLKRVESFIDGHFHHTRRRMVHFSQCMYTRSPDEHFIIDNAGQHENVVFAAGMSGHGFKFAPVIGRRLVGMLEGEEDPLFDFLRVGDRFTSSR